MPGGALGEAGGGGGVCRAQRVGDRRADGAWAGGVQPVVGQGHRNRCGGAGKRQDRRHVHSAVHHELTPLQQLSQSAQDGRTRTATIQSEQGTPASQHSGTLLPAAASPSCEVHLVLHVVNGTSANSRCQRVWTEGEGPRPATGPPWADAASCRGRKRGRKRQGVATAVSRNANCHISQCNRRQRSKRSSVTQKRSGAPLNGV